MNTVPFSDSRSFNLLIIVILWALSGCGQQLVDDGSGILKTAGGEMVSWPTGAKVQFLSDESVPTDLRNHIYFGQEDINNQIDRIQINVEVQKSTAPKIKKSVDEVIGDGKNGIYFLPEPWPWAKTKGKEDSDAMTVLINKGTTIIEADIFYRISTYGSQFETQPTNITHRANVRDGFATEMESTNTFVNLENTNYFSELTSAEKWTKVAFVHECMHAIGFTHVTNERDSIMYPSVSNMLYDNPFSEGDLKRLKLLY